MRSIVRFLIPLLLLSLLACALPAGAEEAACVIALSGSSLVKGDALTVTVTFTAASVGAVDATLSYDPAVLQFDSGDDASGGGGVVRIAGYATSEVKQLRFKLQFTALAAGSCRITVQSSSVYSWDEEPLGGPTAGATVTVQDKSLSANADLKEIALSAGRLSPAFAPGNVAYTVTVENRVTALNISAVPADGDARVSISGSNSLKVGENRRVITVTAPAGNTKEYTVTVVRKNAPVTTAATTPRPTATKAPATTAAPQPPRVFTWQGTDYQVGDPAAHPMPGDFEVTGTLSHGGEELPCALSGNGKIALLYLTDGEGNANWYLFRESEDLLAPYEAISANGRSYILLPRGEAPAADMQPVNADVAGKTWEGWQQEGSPFLFICAMGPAGETGWYAWDGEEGTLQRMYLLTPPTEETTTVTTAEALTTTAAEPTATGTEPAGATAVAGPGAEQPWRRWLPWGAAGLLGLTAAALAILLIRERAVPVSKETPRH